MPRHTATMARKQTAGRSGDRHKPGRQVRIPQSLGEVLEDLAAKRVTSVPEEVKRAIREMLEREGYWPPASAK